MDEILQYLGYSHAFPSGTSVTQGDLEVVTDETRSVVDTLLKNAV